MSRKLDQGIQDTVVNTGVVLLPPLVRQEKEEKEERKKALLCDTRDTQTLYTDQPVMDLKRK